jgi:segregation and condensation protein B
VAESLDTQREHWRRLLEALLFVAWEPAPVKRLAEALGLEPKFTQELLLELQEAYVGRGFQLVEIAGGWQFLTQPEAAPYIERLYKPRAQQLSKAALETLAIVAYRQPVTRAEIDNIRQVKSDAMLAKLMEKTLVKEVGRLDAPGRPILYGTTQEFLAAFGLVSLQELPPLADIDENEEISLFSALQQQLEQE